MDLNQLENSCKTFIEKDVSADAAHDVAHIQRVVNNSKIILDQTTADRQIVLAASWLHDCVALPKNHPDRKKSSQLAADKAGKFLKSISFPQDKIPAVCHAIESHSFSAGIKPRTPEAEIVQDADRIDALGAIGIARCFAVGGQLKTSLYNPDDPFCEQRIPDDSKFTVDHFFTKLFKLPETMNTEQGRALARDRAKYMEKYLSQLSAEIT
ncbi:HD domain-containing protein [Rhodohalobacter sp. SW132]|uniref:HD domain-containing protein n=1 Tax=Rhodohalobacter sp. SW132 TaxID=2293433 RepID=UPI000E254565|nr:HD domain-containing protein [Rhodohalobacter sp. SW132]REL38947.1 HD domain-containing protein [Rhodohalobacter sp. SW132]